MTRKRVVNHAGAAWVAALAGAWVVAAACRTMQGGVASAPAGVSTAARRPSRDGPPSPRSASGVLPGVARASIGADSGVVVHGRAPGETAVRVRTLPRATFHTTAAGRLRLLETGDELELASVSPAVPAELLQADATPYRGLLEVRPGRGGDADGRERRQPGGLPPGGDPERALAPGLPADRGAEGAGGRGAHLRALAPGRLLLEGLRRLRDALLPGLPGAVLGAPPDRPRGRGDEGDRGHLARAGPIHAFYTSTCGGHTEGGDAIFDDDAPYLRGVACLPERSSRHAVRTTSPPRRDLPGGPETARDVALLEALGVIDAADAAPARLEGIPTDAEVRAWTGRLQAALHRSGCDSPVSGALARRATFARHLVASACWSERAERLLAPGDAEYLLAGRGHGEAGPRGAAGPRPARARGAGFAGAGQHAAPRRRADPGRGARAHRGRGREGRRPRPRRRASWRGSPRGR